jgi:hypothetical protein
MFRLLIFPFRQKLSMTPRLLLAILLWWFVLGCRAGWDSDDDPGKWGNYGRVSSIVLVDYWQKTDFKLNLTTSKELYP